MSARRGCSSSPPGRATPSRRSASGRNGRGATMERGARDCGAARIPPPTHGPPAGEPLCRLERHLAFTAGGLDLRCGSGSRRSGSSRSRRGTRRCRRGRAARAGGGGEGGAHARWALPWGPLGWPRSPRRTRPGDRRMAAVMGLALVDGVALVLLSSVAALAEPCKAAPFACRSPIGWGGSCCWQGLSGWHWRPPVPLRWPPPGPGSRRSASDRHSGVGDWDRSERVTPLSVKAAPRRRRPWCSPPSMSARRGARLGSRGSQAPRLHVADCEQRRRAGVGSASVEGGRWGRSRPAGARGAAGLGHAESAHPPRPRRHQIFLAALVLLALRREGLSLLVIAEDPKSIQARVAGAFAASGRWPAGELVLGGKAAREAFAAGRTPAAVFVSGPRALQ